MNPFNTTFNKVSYTTVANAAITLVNGRIPADIQLSADEMGLVMTIVSAALIYFLPNKAA